MVRCVPLKSVAVISSLVLSVSSSAVICAFNASCTAWIEAVSFKSERSTVLVLPSSNVSVRIFPLRLKSVMFWSSLPVLLKTERSTFTVEPSALVSVRIFPLRFASVRSSLLALVSRSAKICAARELFTSSIFVVSSVCTAAIAAESFKSDKSTTTEPPSSRVRFKSFPFSVKLWSCWSSVPVPDNEDRSTVIVFPFSMLRFNVVPVRLKSCKF